MFKGQKKQVLSNLTLSMDYLRNKSCQPHALLQTIMVTGGKLRFVALFRFKWHATDAQLGEISGKRNDLEDFLR